MKKLYALFLVLVASVAFATHEVNPFTGSGGGGVSSVSGTAPVSVASGSTTPVVSMSVADSATDGYLSSTDWGTFNGKVPSTRNVSTTAPLTGGGNLSADRTLSIPVATSAANGYLASGDWSTFNGKVTSVSGTAPVVSSGGATPAISMHVADVSDNGYLTSTDWATFNGKQAAGSYITALTGDVTASGPGSAAATLATVTTAKGGTNATSWTAGSIPYLSTSTQFAQDNTKLFYDATNKRVGIGTSAPATTLEINGAALNPNLPGLIVEADTDNATDALGIVVKGPNANDSGIMLWNTSGTPQKWTFRVNGSAGPFQVIDTTAGTTAMSIAAGTENISIGNGYSANVAALDVKGGIRMNTGGSKPTCDSTTRGEMWVQQVGAGTTDTFFVCLKAAADTYSWVSIVTGG